MKVELCVNCDNVWVDYTAFTTLDNFKVFVNLDAEDNPQKNSTSEIELFGSAYQLFADNIINSPNIYSNYICAKITDVNCSNSVTYFKIDSKGVRWCDNDECIIRLTMIESNDIIDCIERTAISDNSLGRFDRFSPLSIPKFRYCDVIKPTFLFGTLITFFNMIDSVIASINAILSLIDAILGTGTIGYTATSLIGCDRVHPSPFVKDYISNVCDICGVSVDNVTSPIFHEPIVNIGGIDYENPYYKASLLTAYVTKGFKQGYPATQYLETNKPSWTLDIFSSHLKKLYNARWFLYDNTFFFERKDKIGELIWGAGYQLDLTDSDIKEKIIDNVCFNWNGQGKPNRLNYAYGTDATDTQGNELLKRFNGEYIEPIINPNFSESVLVNADVFGVPSFVLDGNDSHNDAILTKSIASTLTGNPFVGCLKMQSDTAQLAKILIWDGVDLEDARTLGALYDNYGSAGADIKSLQNDDANFFPISSSDCYNYNYPMSFDPDANGIGNAYNLWEFNQIDIPNDAKKTNIAFTFKLRFCCSFLNLNLYQKVKLSSTFDGEINALEFDYQNQEIIVKGNLI